MAIRIENAIKQCGYDNLRRWLYLVLATYKPLLFPVSLYYFISFRLRLSLTIVAYRSLRCRLRRFRRHFELLAIGYLPQAFSGGFRLGATSDRDINTGHDYTSHSGSGSERVDGTIPNKGAIGA